MKIEELTNKYPQAYREFLSWYGKKSIDELNYPMYAFFRRMPFEMQIGVFVKFFSEFNIHVPIQNREEKDQIMEVGVAFNKLDQRVETANQPL